MVVTAESAPERAVPERGGRRWTKWLLVTAIVLAVVAIGYIVRYQPLEHGGGVFAAGTVVGGRSDFVFGKPSKDVANYLGTQAVVGPFRAGGRFGFVVTLWNKGRFPVTIVDVEPLLMEGVSRGTQMYVARDESDPVGTMTPAEDVTMPAGEYRTLAFAVDVRGDCEPGDSGLTITITQVPLTYRFLGIPHTATIPLDEYAVSLRGPPSCP